MVDFDAALQNKYRILGQEADARTTTANADAGLANARAAALPIETQAQAGLYGAQSGLYGAQADVAHADLAPASQALQAAVMNRIQQHQAAQWGLPGFGDGMGQPQADPNAPVETRPNGPTGSKLITFPGKGLPASQPAAPATGQPATNFAAPGVGSYAATAASPSISTLPPADPNDPNDPRNKQPIHYSTGGIVPGHGSGAVDKVPAVLAPHEAVLNAGAAAHLGPHLIDVMNSIGAHKMAMEGNAPQVQAQQSGPAQAPGKGMPAPKGKPEAKGKPPEHHAQGTANVGAGGGSGSYGDYLQGLQTQNPTSTANVVSDMRAKLGGPSAPRPQPK
jgi:hypothetical protein